MRSVTTQPSLIWAGSSVLAMPLTGWPPLADERLAQAGQIARSRTARGGTKLASHRPPSRAAPATRSPDIGLAARDHLDVAGRSPASAPRRASSTAYTGRQYTPVDSIATSVTRRAGASREAARPPSRVAKVFVSPAAFAGPRPAGGRTPPPSPCERRGPHTRLRRRPCLAAFRREQGVSVGRIS